jgi:hypothetical protein
MHTVQVTDITIDEFIDRVVKAMPQTKSGVVSNAAATINILNKREAYRTLNISETLFVKLFGQGLIPCTVNMGTGRNGAPVKRWAEHHLLMIKPIIQKLRYNQDKNSLDEAKRQIEELFGISGKTIKRIL